MKIVIIVTAALVATLSVAAAADLPRKEPSPGGGGANRQVPGGQISGRARGMDPWAAAKKRPRGSQRLLLNFRHQGKKAIEKVARNQPGVYLKILALLVPRKTKVESLKADRECHAS